MFNLPSKKEQRGKQRQRDIERGREKRRERESRRKREEPTWLQASPEPCLDLGGDRENPGEGQLRGLREGLKGFLAQGSVG